MSRTNLLLTGGSASKETIRTQFLVIIGLGVLNYILMTFSSFMLYTGFFAQLISLGVFMFARMTIRKRDKIPTGSCGALEDCCAACFCSCCVTAQLMRQTADYGEVEGEWFTQTGLPVADSV